MLERNLFMNDLVNGQDNSFINQSTYYDENEFVSAQEAWMNEQMFWDFSGDREEIYAPCSSEYGLFPYEGENWEDDFFSTTEKIILKTFMINIPYVAKRFVSKQSIHLIPVAHSDIITKKF